MFPLAIGPEQNALMQISPAIVWVAAVLASNLTIDGIFRSDYEDGSLEQMILSPHSGFALVMAKILAHWLLAGVPLIIMVLMAGPFLYLPDTASQTLFYTLLLGTPVLSLMGAIAGADHGRQEQWNVTGPVNSTADYAIIDIFCFSSKQFNERPAGNWRVVFSCCHIGARSDAGAHCSIFSVKNKIE